jgi:hypothetical protein
MRNADQPASPAPHQNSDGFIQHDVYFGLTKREAFAMAAMQGIISNPAHNNPYLMGVNGNSEIGYIGLQKAVRESIRFADELLKQLESDVK